MEIDFSNGALKYLKKKQADSIIIRLVDLGACGGDIDMVKDIEILCGEPEDREQFRLIRQKGFAVFIDKRLKVPGNVKIKKQGFWKFSFLYPDGVLVPL